MAGAIIRQGPHHSAQKSTRTGSREFKTSASKAASVKTSVLSPAMSISSVLMFEQAQRFNPLRSADGTGSHIHAPKHPRKNPCSSPARPAPTTVPGAETRLTPHESRPKEPRQNTPG